MFNNKTKCGIHATRFIMSWVRMGGTLRYGEDYEDFEEWLKTLIIDGENLSHEDVHHIVELARNGKMELEYSAKKFIKNNQKQD